MAAVSHRLWGVMSHRLLLSVRRATSSIAAASSWWLYGCIRIVSITVVISECPRVSALSDGEMKMACRHRHRAVRAEN
jgi:hypothetical protein